MSTVTLRPALPQDESFLYDLYSAVRAAEFALAPVSAEQKEQLIRMQFQSQMASYARSFPNSCCQVVLLDGELVGRLWVAQDEREIHLVDIAVHPTVQHKGIGTALLQRIQGEATRAGLPIRSCVFRFNPGSFRFHQRLGFSVYREDDLQFYMEWRPIAAL